MAIPLALPLAPVLFPGATAAAATFVVGSSVYLANSIYGFRRPVSLPRVTGLEGVATLTEKVADYLAAARVPVGFPVPPPMQDPTGSIIGFGVWAVDQAKSRLAQLAELVPDWQSWGLFNSRPNRSIYNPPVPGANPATGTVPPPGNTVGATLLLTVGTEIYKYVQTPGCNFPNTSTAQVNFTWTLTNVVEVLGPLGDVKTCGYSNLYYLIRFANGTTQRRGPGAGAGIALTSWNAGYGFQWQHPTAVPFPNPFSDSTPAGYVAPQVETGSLPETIPPAPLPWTLPSPAPDGEPLPEVEPITEPAALPALPPAIPSAPPLTAPAFPEEPRQINNSGVLIPLAPAPAAITPTDAHYPVPGGAPVGSIAKAPAATLAAIAVEVGRVEQKLERLLNPLASDNAGDLMRLVWDAAQQIINAQLDNRDGGEYVLSSPCELDANGDRIESTVAYPETEDNFSAVLVRLDALAALLQTHKELKQPICRQTPAVGQPVTVQFVQIE